MDLHDVSEDQLYRLKSIDPRLTPNWREVIQHILPQLDKESQDSIHKNILAPRGIYLDTNEELAHKQPLSLKATLEAVQTDNKDLMAIASDMLNIIDSHQECYGALQLADEIEAIFDSLDSLDLYNLANEHENRKKIRIAFLYDLAQWIDTINLEVKPGLRKLDAHMVKAYLKQVFIRQKIQGRDFRKWDSSHISFQESTYLPSYIKNEGKDRKFILVEGPKYWFLIGHPSHLDENPYSFRRFLFEDSSGTEVKKYIYLTHIIFRKDKIHDAQYLSYVSYTISRLYTLDTGVSDTLLNFVSETQSLHKKYLKPLLKERLKQDGRSIEAVIKERMTTYEKQVSVLILRKLPRVIQTTLHNTKDQDYLFYHLDQLVKAMIDDIQNFRLQPLAKSSASSEIMAIKLISIRKLLQKSQKLLCSPNLSIEERSETMVSSLSTIKEKLGESEESVKNLNHLKNIINSKPQLKEKRSFWQRIKSKRIPKYTLEEIGKKELALQEEFFVSILRLAKIRNKDMVYLELETEEILNQNYRHYALADGELGISLLPRILRLPEDKKKFNIGSIREVVNQNIFESNQAWNIKA